MPSPQDGASEAGPGVAAPAPSLEGMGSALSGALSASSSADYVEAGTDRTSGLSGVLSGGSTPGTTAARLPRWKGRRIGRYRLVESLGKGSYGRVFVADDLDLHRKVALKIVSAESTAASLRGENQSPTRTGVSASQTGASPPTEQFETLAAKVVEKTLSEARAAARLEHPNVVHVYEVGRLPAPAGSPPGAVQGGYIAMELLEGGTLHDWIKAKGPMEVGRACSLVADAAEALQFAHEQGVVHRDLKPANLMLSRHGRCKVVDFGLAMEHDPDGLNKAPIAGTLMFVAPEVTLGKPPGPKSDQYSLGVTLWTLLAARPPYTGNKQQLLDGHRTGTPPSLRALRPEIPEALELAILRAMEKDPDRRFHTVKQFGQTLRTFSGEATAVDATGSFLPDLFADLDDPKAAEAPAKPAAPPPVFAEPQFIAPSKVAAPRAPVVRSPVLAGPGLPPGKRRTTPARKGPENKPVIWPWMAGAAAAILFLLSLIVWAVNSRSSTPTVATAPEQASEGTKGQAPVQRPPPRPNQNSQSTPQPGRPIPQEPKTSVDPQPVPTPIEQPAQPAQPPDAQQPRNVADPPTMQPSGTGQPQIPPSDQPVVSPSTQQPPLASGTVAPAPEAAPADAANQTVLPAADFIKLLVIAQGEDPERKDRRVVAEGKIASVGMTADGWLRLEFVGAAPRRTVLAHVNIADKELLKALQQKLGSKAEHLDVEGKTLIVRGLVTMQTGSPCLLITSADQVEGVPPGKERFPVAQGPGNRPGVRRPPGRN